MYNIFMSSSSFSLRLKLNCYDKDNTKMTMMKLIDMITTLKYRKKNTKHPNSYKMKSL